MPDSGGAVYAHFTYKNNSKYPIVSFQLTANLKDKNEMTSFSSVDTVMSGETSPSFNGLGPSSTIDKDIEFLTLEYKIKNSETGKYLLITYDYKLNQYQALEMDE